MALHEEERSLPPLAETPYVWCERHMAATGQGGCEVVAVEVDHLRDLGLLPVANKRFLSSSKMAWRTDEELVIDSLVGNQDTEWHDDVVLDVHRHPAYQHTIPPLLINHLGIQGRGKTKMLKPQQGREDGARIALP